MWVCQDKDGTKFANLGNTNTTSYNGRARYQVVGNHSEDADWEECIRINEVRISAERTIDAGNVLGSELGHRTAEYPGQQSILGSQCKVLGVASTSIHLD